MRQVASKKRQGGAVLLILLTIIVLGSATLLVSKLGKSNWFLKHDQKNMMVLAEAKSTLLGWSLSRELLNHPGLMPFPDQNGDGESDCPGLGVVVTEAHLIGQLPISFDRDTGCAGTGGLGVLPLDSANERLWYAVSSNLVYDSENDAYPNLYNRLTTATTNWLEVVGQDGVTLSDRVAVVIFSPASPLQGQNRTVMVASNYLELYTTPPPTSVTINNSNPTDRTYIAGDPKDGNSIFNDRLITITVAELLALVDKRL